MEMDFMILMNECRKELEEMGYSDRYCIRIYNEWRRVNEWLRKNSIDHFDESAGFRYCDEVFGTHILKEGMKTKEKVKLRAVRMIISFQKNKEFEFRSPRVEEQFSGPSSEAINTYIDYITDVQCLSYKTVTNKRHYLYKLNCFLNVRNLAPDELSIELLESFFKEYCNSPASRHNACSTVRIFLKFAYDSGYTEKDCSVFCLPDHYKKQARLPTTYTEEEITKIIQSVERASAIGKRDYLVILLSAEYGWRAQDIVRLTFDNIDWKNNVIRFTQHKTGNAVEYPLLASVGNAIIDYLQHGRPQCDVRQIIVSHCHNYSTFGKPISEATTHSIITKYMRKAKIKDWQNKKHGTHALRHSLATNMLAKNISLPVISTVIGHQSTETTKIYLSVDYDKLKMCALPMPDLHSPFYSGGHEDGKQ